MSAIRSVKDLSTNPEFVGYYDKEEAIKWDLAAMKQTGIDEGIEIGKALVVKEYTEKVVKKMLKENIPLETIVKCSDLKLKEVKQIQKELENEN